MNFKNYHHLIKEGFNIEEFLTTPREFSSKREMGDYDLAAVLREFNKLGGTLIGSGCYGKVLSHPSWNYICKIYSDDPCYTRYMRFCLQNQKEKFCPKILDKPRKILPNYTRMAATENLYIVKMEKLKPLNSVISEGLSGLYFSLNDSGYFENKNTMDLDGLLQSYKNRYGPTYYGEIVESLAKDWIIYIGKMIDSIPNINECRFDLHSGNIMARNDGTPVLVDPLAIDNDQCNFTKKATAKGLDSDNARLHKWNIVYPGKKYKFK